MARKRKLSDRYRGQVKAETRLRFDPEAQTVREARRDARSQMRGDIRAAEVTAGGISRAARASLPVARKRLGEALSTVSARPAPDLDLGVLGPAAARDAEGAKRRLAETLAGTEQELIMRRNDAVAGRASATRQARAVFADTSSKLSDRMRSIAQQRGLFAQQRSGELVEDARGRALTRRGQDVTRKNNRDSTKQSERGSLRTSGIDPDTGKPIKGGRLDPDANGVRGDQSKGKKAKGGATAQQVIDASSAIDLAKRQAQRAKSDGESRSGAAKLLVEGQKELKDPKTGKAIPDTQYKAVKQLWASVALDLTYDGRISARNRQRLHKLGYSLADLGIKGPPKAGNDGINQRARSNFPGGRVT